VFQLGHLLMYPIFGLLMAHGSAQLFQWTMLGYFLALPALLVLIERIVRVCVGFRRINAEIRILDSETVEIKAKIPSELFWRYAAGQYVFLQVPKISLFQWHPFTVSACVDKTMWLHIKTDGNWTSKLRDLGSENGLSPIEIGINGPFGAPAQRFYDFTHTIVVGAGIGITPFSGVLADLQAKDDQSHGGPAATGLAKPEPATGEKSNEENSGEAAEAGAKAAASPTAPNASEGSLSSDSAGPPCPKQQGSRAVFAPDYRRVDFHWIVRDRNHLLWFSDLLNAVARSQLWHGAHDAQGHRHLDIRMQTHVTRRRKNISTHVYRWLLETHRTETHPESPLTGLLNPTHFGRPDFVRILDAHYEEMKAFRAGRLEALRERGESESTYEDEADEDFKVGVFFCGTPVVGEMLADRCRALSARGRTDGTKIEYHFMMEVFG
jgi:dual oxidase